MSARKSSDTHPMLSALDICLLMALMLGGSAALTTQITISSYRTCWGDIEATDAARTGREESAEWFSGLELRHEPIYYRGEEGKEIGWRSAWLVDPSSCAQTQIQVMRYDGGYLERIQLLRDPSNDIYRFTAVASTRETEVAFRRRMSPGHTLTHLSLRVVNLVVLAAATAVAAVGFRAMRRRARADGAIKAVTATGSAAFLVATVLAIGAAVISRYR
jgi:hypothetical protein